MTSPVLQPCPSATPLVDLVSGSFGAGHDAAAAAIATQLQDRGCRTRTWDIVDLMPAGIGRLTRSGYLRQVQAAPSSWRWVLDQIERHPAVAETVTRLLGTAGGSLLDVAAADQPSMFVSTHPFASQALGMLRRQGRLRVPVTTYLTDMSVHRMWVHSGVDQHLAIHDVPGNQARALGARGTLTVTPAVDAAFRGGSGRSRGVVRRWWGLPELGPLALVTGGSCGIGRLEEAALDLAATGLVTPVVLCGTNRRLLERVRRDRRLLGLGWVADMPDLLRAVDVVVQNAGGITSLESLATGVPVLTYRCIAGHGETNAAALDSVAMAPWVRERRDLDPALRRALAAPRGHVEAAPVPGVADALLGISALAS